MGCCGASAMGHESSKASRGVVGLPSVTQRSGLSLDEESKFSAREKSVTTSSLTISLMESLAADDESYRLSIVGCCKLGLSSSS